MRSGRAWIAVTGVALTLCGCAGVPTSGGVHVGRPLPADIGQDTERIGGRPSGPLPGMHPTDLVDGFLDAQVDADNGFAIARTFLAPGTEWNPHSGISIFDDSSIKVRRIDARLVEVDVRRTGVVDPRGDFRVEPGSLRLRFGLARRSGQWRISHLPPGALLGTQDAERSLVPASIYYLNQEQTTVVPEPVLLPPSQPGFATRLIQDLLDGPSAALDPAVQTAVPHNASLQGNVTIDENGTAELNLIDSGPQLSSIQLQRLSAQVIWTLRQVPSIVSVRILVNGALAGPEGVPLTQPIASWAQFDPHAAPRRRGALFVDAGKVVGYGLTVPVRLQHLDVDQVAMSADGGRIAALRETAVADQLLVGSSAGPLAARLEAGSLASPTFDPEGDVFVVERTVRLSKLVEVPVQGRVRAVVVPPAVGAAGIDAVAISRDGSRVAMVVGPAGRAELLIGGLAGTAAHPQVVGLATVLPASRQVQGVAWTGGDEVVTTVRRTPGRRGLIEVTVDGYTTHPLTSLGLPGDATQVAAAPGQPTLAVADGAVWLLSRQWQQVAAGADPGYAG